VGKRVPPEMVLPVFVVVVLFFALLISYPWEVLTAGTLAYLACLPLGWWSYNEYKRKDAGTAAAASTASTDMPPAHEGPGLESSSLESSSLADEDDERPARLN
jgi:CDP-diacylglycerol--serine O-phosphatidyltransferase